MSALARILLKQGHKVTGSDVHFNPLMDELISDGAKIWVGHEAEHIREGTVVFSSAISENNGEFVRAKQIGLPLLHRSDLLDQIMEKRKVLQVSGTHGKTTTTSLLSCVLLEGGLDPSFVVGGIVEALKSNARKGEGPYFVAEADESDGSFLKTKSFGAIVTNCENDHLDYWKSEEKLNQGFRAFFSQVERSEHLFWCRDDIRLSSFQLPGFSYGFSRDADLQITNFIQTEKGVVFNLQFQGKEYKKIELSLLGRHNALNGAAVFGLCLTLNVDEKFIRKAFIEFQGTKRRLEKKGIEHAVVCYDDYGHHPTEIKATLQALRGAICEKKLIVLFQPHRFTRTEDLWRDFTQCFAGSDLVIITDIYSAGENPLDGVSSEKLALEIKNAIYVPKDQVVERVASLLKPFDVLLTMGAGDVTHMGTPILKRYREIRPKYKVAVLSGGTSSEHEVSKLSAENITRSLNPAYYDVVEFHISKQGDWNEEKNLPKAIASLLECDIAIPVFHGPQGEDGMMQGFLEALHIPYVGCDYQSSAICMNKAWTKQVVNAHQIPIVPYIEMDRRTYRSDPSLLLKRIQEKLTFPVWVKAAHLGSSIGVSRAVSPDEVAQCAEISFALDDYLIVEQEVVGREIEFAVLGNEVIRIAAPCTILTDGAFYDYEKKYGSAASKVEIPAKITAIERAIGSDLAKEAYIALGCKGLARVDFFLDERGVFWLNEVNPFPGFTQGSGYPKMWEYNGMALSELINELIILGLSRSAKIRGKR